MPMLQAIGKFPLKDSKRVTQWLKAVQRNNWTPTKYSFLCSEHFSKDCFFKRFESQHRSLKPTAVPSIFQSAERRATHGYALHKRETESQSPEDDACLACSWSWEQDNQSVPLDQEISELQKKKGTEQRAVEADTLVSEQNESIMLLSEGVLPRPSIADTEFPLKIEKSFAQDDAHPTDGGSREKHNPAVSLDQNTSLKQKTKGIEQGTAEADTLGSEQRESIILLSEGVLPRPSIADTEFPLKIEKSFAQDDAHPTDGGSREKHNPAVSLDQNTSLKQKTKGIEQGTAEADTLGSEQRESIILLSEGVLSRSLMVTAESPVKTERSSSENCTQTNIHIGNWMTDTSGISIDDFSPPVSGACKFIGSLHSYSFSSKHSRERPSVSREPPERKRAKRNMESSHRIGGVPLVPDKNSLESSSPSPRTVAPQKSTESPSVAPADLTPKSATEAAPRKKGDANPSFMSINEVIVSASGTCKLIDSLHTYCFSSSRQAKAQVCCLQEQVEKKNMELKLLRKRLNRSDSRVKKLREKVAELKRLSIPSPCSQQSRDSEMPLLNPMLEPLAWMLGTWVSEPPGDGVFPTIQPFNYIEEVQISHVGQPVLNFMFNAFHPETKKPMHRECGFIRLKPGTSKVAFVSAQNTGIVEVEEGEVNGQELTITSHSVARISFAKEPHVQQISRNFRMTADGKLEQSVSMATSTQPMTQHLHITYKKVTP
ncbi:THAP domain-containing protein 4 isoform X3 [Rhinatrema bivittatum]|uniref:THAP domain-containing protein 4 isoform X3 n=1 Tax=Rhinatrema bivittatum TaxID=194408 RepID=UPI00112662D3|nr:THAP domain-containing protein 4 isoform X3 [Rhinatrema bivittatum]